jgi:hypothetical protein
MVNGYFNYKLTVETPVSRDSTHSMWEHSPDVQQLDIEN